MKVIIDITEEEYKGIKGYPYGHTFYPWTIHLYDALKNGTPLTEVFEDIKVEILDLDYLVDSAKYSDSETRCHNVDYLVSEILKIIDRHISAEGSENADSN